MPGAGFSGRLRKRAFLQFKANVGETLSSVRIVPSRGGFVFHAPAPPCREGTSPNLKIDKLLHCRPGPAAVGSFCKSACSPRSGRSLSQNTGPPADGPTGTKRRDKSPGQPGAQEHPTHAGAKRRHRSDIPFNHTKAPHPPSSESSGAERIPDPARIQHSPHLRRAVHDPVGPPPVPPVRVDRVHPPPGRRGFHLFQRVVPLRLQDQVPPALAAEADEKVRDVVVRLTVVQAPASRTPARPPGVPAHE
jgi:hypothetical protein